MDPNLIMLFHILITVAASIMLATNRNTIFLENNPGAPSYIWGFFQAYVAVGNFGAFALLLLYGLITNIIDECNIGYLVHAVVMTVCGLLVLKRNKWAFIIMTLLSLNIILYIINGVYIKKRWNK